MKCLFLSALILGVLLCCTRQEQESSLQHDGGANEDTPVTNPNLHTIKIGGVPLHVEIAQKEEDREHGLMFREDLAENEGMLFVFPSTRILSFWMRNTFIPLDIAFISDDGAVVDIQHMEPLDESKRYISQAPALYALEVRAGWFEKNKIKVGSRVVF